MVSNIVVEPSGKKGMYCVNYYSDGVLQDDFGVGYSLEQACSIAHDVCLMNGFASYDILRKETVRVRKVH